MNLAYLLSAKDSRYSLVRPAWFLEVIDPLLKRVESCYLKNKHNLFSFCCVYFSSGQVKARLIPAGRKNDCETQTKPARNVQQDERVHSTIKSIKLY